MSKLKTIFTFCAIFSFLSLMAQDNPLVRYPSLSPDGTAVSFSYQGDIWTVPATGGIARRLTIHESYESHPQWSPDGQQILFRGDRFGNADLFVMNKSGSKPKRLTFHSAYDSAARWGAKGQIYFNSSRVYRQVERESEIHRISKDGGTPQRALDAVGLMPAPSPDGQFVALVRGNCRIEREAYTGPANRNIWVHNIKNKSYHQITDFKGQDIYPDWGGGDLYYLKAIEGRYNLVKQKLKPTGEADGKVEVLTNFTDEGIRYFDVNNEGTQIIFERGEGVYTMPAQAGASPKLLSVQLTEDDRFDPIEHKTFTKKARDYALSPNEKLMAFVVRGELFLKKNDKEKKRAVQLTKHPFRDKEPVWLNDSTLLFVSDRNGHFDLFALQSADTKEGDLFKTFKLKTTALTKNTEDEESIVLSPDRKKIVFRRGRGQVVIADISSSGTLSNERLLLDGWSTVKGLAWSPDSRWLSYAMEDLNFNEEIYIHKVEGNEKPVNVSLHPRRDYAPKWSKDGSKLAFLSDRNNGDTDVWFVWLKKEDWEKTKQDWEEEEDEEPKKAKKKKGNKKDDDKDKKEKKEKEVEPIKIDFEDIHERLQQVTRIAGNERNVMIDHKGEMVYFTTNGGGRAGSPGPADLMSIKWDGTEVKTMLPKLSVSNLQWSKDGKYLYAVKKGGNLIKIKVDGAKQEPLGFSAKMDINHREERKQVFEEAWRRLRDGFYDPNFHGQDWDKLREKYYDRAINASTSQDFQYFYNEMLGQLNASHMGLFGVAKPEEVQKERTGLLGIEMEPVSQGLKITKVLPNTPASRTASLLNVGDIIRAVDGTAIDASTNFYALMNGKASERTLLEVQNTAGVKRDVIIRPTNSIRTALYEDWVKERKRLTEKYSNGKLGYIHIQGMNWRSFERFERELTASGLGKDGLVIDVRFNGGGWTTDMLMAVLTVRQHAYTIPRGAAESLDKEHQKFKEYYPYGERLPLASWTKPSIAMCNENSYSNAEIFSHAYKHLDLGTLVGQPTFGAVISTGGKGMLDGSYVRMPFRAWYVKATEENMELGPAVPDILVENRPDSKAKGEDLQLKRAVEELLKEMGTPIKD